MSYHGALKAGERRKSLVLQRPRSAWILFNIVLFAGYAVFDLMSLFLPAGVKSAWIIILFLFTSFVNVIIVRGLALMANRINFIVALVSFLMFLHLLIFISQPLGMGLAYIGPSRAFYYIFISMMSMIIDESRIRYAVLAFNLLMACLHVVNMFYFTRKRVAALFRPL